MFLKIIFIKYAIAKMRWVFLTGNKIILYGINSDIAAQTSEEMTAIPELITQ